MRRYSTKYAYCDECRKRTNAEYNDITVSERRMVKTQWHAYTVTSPVLKVHNINVEIIEFVLKTFASMNGAGHTPWYPTLQNHIVTYKGSNT